MKTVTELENAHWYRNTKCFEKQGLSGKMLIDPAGNNEKKNLEI